MTALTIQKQQYGPFYRFVIKNMNISVFLHHNI